MDFDPKFESKKGRCISIINILLLDDEARMRDVVSFELSKRIKFTYNMLVFDSYNEELAEYISESEIPTVYILDIMIGQRDVDGIVIARKIKKRRNRRHRVIFLTDHTDQAVMAIRYQTDAIDFICKKDFNFIDLLMIALEKARKEIKAAVDEDDENFITFYADYNPVRMGLKDIISCEKIGDKKISVCTVVDGRIVKYTVSKTIKSFARELGEDFYSISRTVLVNLKNVGMVLPESGIVKMKYGIELEAPENNLREMIKCLNK